MSALSGKSFVKYSDLKNFLETECREYSWDIRRDYLAAFPVYFKKKYKTEDIKDEDVVAKGQYDFKEWASKEMKNRSHGKALASDSVGIFDKIFGA